MEDIVYNLKNVSKTYIAGSTKTNALENVNFNIKRGEVVVILGPSGSGKSTLLNILSGIDIPTSGEVVYLGESIAKLNDKEQTKYRKENLGFIFQSYNLIPNLTVYENVELGQHLATDGLNIDEILKTVGLSEMKYKFPYQLSRWTDAKSSNR